MIELSVTVNGQIRMKDQDSNSWFEQVKVHLKREAINGNDSGDMITFSCYNPEVNLMINRKELERAIKLLSEE